jgi:hypothetical protein
VTNDGVHPNAAGDQKISDRWYPALSAALRRPTPTPTTSPTGSPTPTASPTGSPSPTPTGTPGLGCAADYRVVDQATFGFLATVSGGNSVPTVSCAAS